MKCYFICILAFLSFSCFSQGKDKFAVKNFTQIDTVVVNPDYPCKYYRNLTDPSLLMKEIFWDSARSHIMSREYLKDGIHSGPCIFYTNKGDILTTGYYDNDKKDGEWIYYYYGNTKIKWENHFNKGIKTGAWKEYDEKGKLKHEEIYDAVGNLKEKKTY